MDELAIFVLNGRGFSSLDKDNFVPYQEVGIDKLLPEFIKKRLEYFGYKNYQLIQDLDKISQCDCEYAAVIDIVNPFIDQELLRKMHFSLKKSAHYDMCKSEGAIPGTEPEFLVRTKEWRTKRFEDLSCLEIQHDTQIEYNCQLNLRKLKRIKIFKNIVQYVEGLEKMNIPELMSQLRRDNIFTKVISYFEETSLVYLSKCPHCGREIQPISATVSQPMIGYIPDNKPYYYQCVNCKLIVLSPHLASEESYKLYDMYNKEGQGKDYFIQCKSRHDHYRSGINMIKSFLPPRNAGS